MINLKTFDSAEGINIERKRTVRAYRAEDGHCELLHALVEYPVISPEKENGAADGANITGTAKTKPSDKAKPKGGKKSGKEEVLSVDFRELNAFFASFAANYLAYLEKKLLPSLKNEYLSQNEPQKRRNFSGSHMNTAYAKMSFDFTLAELGNGGGNTGTDDREPESDDKNSAVKTPFKNGVLRYFYGISEKIKGAPFDKQIKKALCGSGIILSVVFDIRVSRGANIVLFQRKSFNYFIGEEHYPEKNMPKKSKTSQKKHSVLLLTEKNIRRCKKSNAEKAQKKNSGADFRNDNADGFYIVPSSLANDRGGMSSGAADAEMCAEIRLYKNRWNSVKTVGTSFDGVKRHGRAVNAQKFVSEITLSRNEYFLHI